MLAPKGVDPSGRLPGEGAVPPIVGEWSTLIAMRAYCEGLARAGKEGFAVYLHSRRAAVVGHSCHRSKSPTPLLISPEWFVDLGIWVVVGLWQVLAWRQKLKDLRQGSISGGSLSKKRHQRQRFVA